MKELDESDFDDNDDESLEYHNDPLLFDRRRRRRRRSSRRRRFFDKIKAFLKEHGEVIKEGVKALIKAAKHCCKVSMKCKTQWWCSFFGKR